jgi:uncharacterized phiE125 gp8 family phage protein
MLNLRNLARPEPATGPSVRVVTPPINDPVTIAEAKRQLNIAASDDAHDDRLADLIQDATETWQHDTHQKLITQTIQHVQERWEPIVRLTWRPLQSIEFVKYRDKDGDLQAVAAGDYSLDLGLGLLRFNRAYTVPSYFSEWNAWQVQYVAGYGANSTDVSQLDRGAILTLVAHKFETPDMLFATAIYSDSRYANLVYKRMRATYP